MTKRAYAEVEVIASLEARNGKMEVVGCTWRVSRGEGEDCTGEITGVSAGDGKAWYPVARVITERLGTDDWELVGAVGSADHYRLFFKKEIKGSGK